MCFKSIKLWEFQLANDPDCMKSVFEDVAPQLSLQWATKFFVGANLPKEEQSSNWCDRPLKEEKMIYAAQVDN